MDNAIGFVVHFALVPLCMESEFLRISVFIQLFNEA
jgi:hypothetical protein